MESFLSSKIINLCCTDLVQKKNRIEFCPKLIGATHVSLAPLCGNVKKSSWQRTERSWHYDHNGLPGTSALWFKFWGDVIISFCFPEFVLLKHRFNLRKYGQNIIKWILICFLFSKWDLWWQNDHNFRTSGPIFKIQSSKLVKI